MRLDRPRVDPSRAQLMDFLLNAEQDEIVSSAGALLAAECPISRIRDGFAERSNVDRNLWATCAALGWFGLGLDAAAESATA